MNAVSVELYTERDVACLNITTDLEKEMHAVSKWTFHAKVKLKLYRYSITRVQKRSVNLSELIGREISCGEIRRVVI